MTEADVCNKLTEIFRDIFLDDTLVATPEMTANNVERWDSLSHVDMMLIVESEFGIRIPTRVVTGMKNVGDLIAFVMSQKA